jgi:hypothetical protein
VRAVVLEALDVLEADEEAGGPVAQQVPESR